MTLFKCKMCGGALEINNNETVATCEYCGTQQTLPKLDDDKRANMYDRANHFRRNNEFDKAMGIYEQILNEDNTDSEAYWSLVLCRYGIEYVEDPSSRKRVPTVNRAQFTSIFDDDNYKSALQYADGYQRTIYEEEAKAINEIQKGILAISQKEEPFDVFICYKETDDAGRRTPDSVLANDLYHQLTQDGFKVFFARITLEDKLGSAYEPYIFAALNSSKVMVVLGTKPEFFNAVWVKNEWSRYLSLIKNGANKMLIPAYKDMDPYDLPEEFSHLQAQDMSKLGFMQDLIRGIKKITKADEPAPAVIMENVVSSANPSTEPLLERAFMFLEDGDWNSANEYCEKVLDIDPKCARAYLGKLMAELNVNAEDSLSDCDNPFDEYDNFAKIMRFGDAQLVAKLKSDIEHINTRNENERLEGIYLEAKRAFSRATEADYRTAVRIFGSISGYKDSEELAKKSLEKAEEARKDDVLIRAKAKMNGVLIISYQDAIGELRTIAGWRDADEQIEICKKKIEEIKAEDEKRKQEHKRQEQLQKEEKERRLKFVKKIAVISAITICIIAAGMILVDSVILSVGEYIKFGSYEQDNDVNNGKEPIEWLVLEKQEDKLLVISKYGLDCKEYNESYTDVTWETCTLRKWLNNDFITSAFSADEKAMIPTVTVSADENPKYNTNPDNAAQDQVFLLSITEANKYFSSDSARQCEPTDYAVANGAHVNSDNSNCWWWLRSPGYRQNRAATVDSDGDVRENGRNVNDDNAAVRPAMWIDLK